MNPRSSGISDRLRDRVLRRAGLDGPPPVNLEGLRRLYNAWCLAVPFDNVRKMIAIRTGAPLPGRDATDFFQSWLETGAGGTGWSGSNALYELAHSLRFNARRAAGSMYDDGSPNHGTVIVTIDSAEWLIDSSLLTAEPIPLAGHPYFRSDGVSAIEVEADAGSHVLWTSAPHQPSSIACRIFSQPLSYDAVLAKYEDSRRQSPFNQRLYARRNDSGRVILLRGRTRFERSIGGLTARDLSEDELRASLRTEFGFSQSLIDAWSRCGALASSLERSSAEPPPPNKGVPPSQRTASASAFSLQNSRPTCP